MIERKDKYIRIRVIGGSGIFDSIMNILKKPIVSKLLTSAGKSVASVLGERLVNRMMPAIQPTASQPTPGSAPGSIATSVTTPTASAAPSVAPIAPSVAPLTQPTASIAPSVAPIATSRRAQELISRYKSKQATAVSQPGGAHKFTEDADPFRGTEGSGISIGGVPTIQEYVKHYKKAAKVGAGIKEIL